MAAELCTILTNIRYDKVYRIRNHDIGNMEKIILIGMADTARDVLCFVRDYNLFEVVGFAVDREYRSADTFCGLPVYCLEELGTIIDKSETGVFIPIQWNYLNRQRRDMYCRLKREGFRFVNIIAPDAVIHSGGSVGENCWISDGVVIESNVTIGDNVFIKTKAWIGHYTVIEDHCFIGAASKVAGKALVGEQSFVGIDAMIFDGVKLGKKCLVGACSVVKRSLPDYSYVKLTDGGGVEIRQCGEFEIEEKLVAAKNIR